MTRQRMIVAGETPMRGAAASEKKNGAGFLRPREVSRGRVARVHTICLRR
jgi:hypothetical protein